MERGLSRISARIIADLSSLNHLLVVIFLFSYGNDSFIRINLRSSAFPDAGGIRVYPRAIFFLYILKTNGTRIVADFSADFR